jgi:hypothetical protein
MKNSENTTAGKIMLIAGKHARASHFPRHTSINATSARCTALYYNKRPVNNQ